MSSAQAEAIEAACPIREVGSSGNPEAGTVPHISRIASPLRPIREIDAAYSELSIEAGFNWVEAFALVDDGDWCLVAFRSKHAPYADDAYLTWLDERASTAASRHPGFMYYFIGTPCPTELAARSASDIAPGSSSGCSRPGTPGRAASVVYPLARNAGAGRWRRWRRGRPRSGMSRWVGPAGGGHPGSAWLPPGPCALPVDAAPAVARTWIRVALDYPGATTRSRGNGPGSRPVSKGIAHDGEVQRGRGCVAADTGYAVQRSRRSASIRLVETHETFQDDHRRAGHRVARGAPPDDTPRLDRAGW